MTQPTRGLAAQVSRALLWNMALIPLQGVVALAASAVVARRLPVAHYAVYGLAMATLTSLLLWSDLGLMPMVSRYAPLLRGAGGAALRRFLWQVSVVRLAAIAAAVLGFAAAWRLPLVRRILPFEGPGLWLLLAALAAQGVARLHEYFLSGLLERRTVGLIRIAVGLAHPLLVIAAVATGGGVNGILAAVCVASLLDVSLFAWAAVTRTHATSATEGPAPALPPDVRQRAARFAAVSFLDKVAGHLNSAGFAIFLVAALGPDNEVAAFAVAGEFAARVLAVLAIPFSGLTLPLFATVEARQPEDTGTAARLYLVVMILVCLPAAGLLWALAEPLVTLVYTARYASAAPILRAFVPFVFVEYAAYSAFLAPLLARERYRAILVSKAPLLIALAAMFWTVPRWGAVGAALTYGIARAVSAGLLLAAGLRVLGVTFPLRFSLRVLAGTAAATALATIWVASGLVPGLAGTFAAATVAALAFLGVYRLAGGMDSADKAVLAQGLGRTASLDRLVTFIL